jgi:hypothetical protein
MRKIQSQSLSLVRSLCLLILFWWYSFHGYKMLRAMLVWEHTMWWWGAWVVSPYHWRIVCPANREKSQGTQSWLCLHPHWRRFAAFMSNLCYLYMLLPPFLSFCDLWAKLTSQNDDLLHFFPISSSWSSVLLSSLWVVNEMLQICSFCV